MIKRNSQRKKIEKIKTIIIDWVSPHDHSRIEIRDLKYKRIMTIDTDLFKDIIKQSDWKRFLNEIEREIELTDEQHKELFSHYL